MRWHILVGRLGCPYKLPARNFLAQSEAVGIQTHSHLPSPASSSPRAPSDLQPRLPFFFILLGSPPPFPPSRPRLGSIHYPALLPIWYRKVKYRQFKGLKWSHFVCDAGGTAGKHWLHILTHSVERGYQGGMSRRSLPEQRHASLPCYVDCAFETYPVAVV